MDILRIAREPVEANGQPGSAVRLEVNGQDLRQLVAQVELPFAQAEGHPSLAGNYVGLPASAVLPPSRHFLGEPAATYDYTDKVTLLQCECGEPGCWPLLARISLTNHTVTWSDFEQPHRRERWDYRALGPFVFDRQQYEDALTNYG